MTNKNIQYISDSYLCSNCGACSAICPKDAISFKWTSMGRMYAQVDPEKCIDCSRCTKVCPSIVEPSKEEYPDRFVGNIKNLYVGRATDEAIFRNAQSGGVCTALLTYLFDQKKIDCAVVCQMEEGNPIPQVKAKLVTDKRELIKSQKSCYTPVEMLSILKQTHDYESVAFVGLPCHIEGVTNLQQQSQKFANIKYKIGLICDRTMCRTVMDVFATYSKQNKIKIDWRRKYDESNGFHYENAPVVVYSKDEEVRIPNMHRFLMKEYFTSPRCRLCYDKINIMADVVLGDPWRMPNIVLTEGASVIICRTPKGQQLIDDATLYEAICIEKHSTEEIIKGQLIDKRKKSVKIHTKAIYKLMPHIDSYIFNDIELNEPNDNSVALFINRENSTHADVISDALKEIKAKTKGPSIFDRILAKFKRII